MSIRGEQSGEVTPEATDRAVVVDGEYLGRELGMFTFASSTEPMLGGARFDEVYLDTDSGNSYLIRRNPKWESVQKFGIMSEKEREDYNIPKLPPNEFEIVNARTNQGKREQDWRATSLSKEDIQGAVLEIGKPFEYRKGRTTRIVSITCVQTKYGYMPDHLKKIAQGKSNVRTEFRRKILSK